MKEYHLTTPQKDIFNLMQYYEDTSIGNQCGAIFFREKRDQKLLHQALRQVITHQKGLRLRFRKEKEPVQYVSDEIGEIPVMTFDTRSEYEDFAKEFAKDPIGWKDQVMYRFVIFELEGRSGILAVMSHLISDAWTFGLIADQVGRAYRSLAEGRKIPWDEADYTEYIQWEDTYLESDRYKKDRIFWEEKYQSIPGKGQIRLHNGEQEDIRAKRIVRKLPLDLDTQIRAYCKQNNVTPAVVFETALTLYLAKINPDNTSITIGIPVLNRKSAAEKQMAGMFVSTMPLTVSCSGKDKVLDLMDAITRGHMEIFRHQKYPFSHILSYLRDKQGFSRSLYDVMISYQNAKTKTEAATEWYSNGYSEVPFVMHIDDRDGTSNHTLSVDYQVAVFREEQEVEWVVDRILYILDQITSEQNLVVQSVQMVPWKEKMQILETFNDTYVDYPRDKCVHELFSEQAKKTPDRVAVIAENEQLTYAQLEQRSDALAQRLLDLGIGKGETVGAYLDRTSYTIISQLAVLKAGGVFLPIDHRYPKDRIDYMLEDCKVGLVLSDQRVQKEWNVDFFDLGIYGFGDVLRQRTESEPEDPCYVIYTSGSTGKPKGCVLTHRGIANFCGNNNIVPYAETLERQTVVSVNTISFDFFIAETLMPLLHGWSVVIASEIESNSKELFQKLVLAHDINIIETTPTRLEIYTKGEEEKEDSYLRQIQCVVSSGEQLTKDLYGRIRKISNAKVFNPLGPSECSVWNAGGEFTDQITIGSPIANTQIYILDKEENLLPIGVAGELCIAGEGVGKGYLNRLDLTAEKFVPNPFATEENHHGRILYHTGDLARWRADGEIEYLGRIDTQVKIRGLRIELGEIESVMSGFSGVELAAVTDKKDEEGRQYLVGYYTSADSLDEPSLRKHLSSKLPKYMVPNYFMRLEEMPMTASGKTDRKNLPLPQFSVGTKTFIPPENETEERLCGLLQEVLHLEKIGVEDDFFEQGGDSLSAIEYVAKAHGIGIDLSLQDIFDYPTIRSLCVHLIEGTKTRVEYQTADFAKYDALLQNNVIREGQIFQKRSLGNVLLTGATGFLGAHILEQLLLQEEGKVYCLIRGSEEREGKERLQGILKYYFGECYERLIGERIIPVMGDVEREDFSEQMPEDVQTVIHTAASVKHYGSYAYFHRINTEGTHHVASYAKRIGARLVHISTLSVSGNSMADDFSVYRSAEEKFFYETTFYMGQPLDNVYIRSKFEAERMVYDAMLDGLDAVVIRVGNLTNRVSDYKFQPNYKENAFLTRVKAILEFGRFPEYLMDLYAEFSPIDKTAEGVLEIARYAKEQCVFHLNSDKVIYFDRFLEVVHTLGIPMEVVSGEAFNKALQETIRRSQTEYIFEAFQNDMDEQGHLVYDSNIRIENEFTLWFLKQVGFTWNETDLEYIRGYVDYFRRIGYLEV